MSTAPRPCAVCRLRTTSWKVRLDKGQLAHPSVSRQPDTNYPTQGTLASWKLWIWNVEQWFFLLEDDFAKVPKSYSGSGSEIKRIYKSCFSWKCKALFDELEACKILFSGSNLEPRAWSFSVLFFLCFLPLCSVCLFTTGNGAPRCL